MGTYHRVYNSFYERMHVGHLGHCACVLRSRTQASIYLQSVALSVCTVFGLLINLALQSSVLMMVCLLRCMLWHNFLHA
jgi:hypothetical protein